MSSNNKNNNNRADILALLKETTRRIELMDSKSPLVSMMFSMLGAYTSGRERQMLDYLMPHIKSEMAYCKKMKELGDGDEN